MSKERISILLFAESKNREDVYQNRLPIQTREVHKLLENLSAVFEVDPHIPEIRSKRDGLRYAKQVNQNDCAAVLLYIPTFNQPAIVAHTARALTKPMALAGNRAKDSLSQLGYLASGGALEQAGIPVKRILPDAGDPAAAQELLYWVRAAKAVAALRGQTYGCIGGRSLGISTGTADAAQWERQFGVDIEQIDQLELVHRAQAILPEQIDQAVSNIQQLYGKVCFSEADRFTPAHLRRMVASYLAMKSIVADYELDFCGIKCQTELSNGFCLQCLTVQLLNDPYDLDGPKPPIVCSCEADADGALSMQILKHLSGGKPTALQDIASISDSGFVLANCGAMASWFSTLSEHPVENLAQVHLMPHGFGIAGGAATQFVCAAGTFTYMRMFRRNGAYHMGFFCGETEKRPREALKDYSPYRPTSFVRHPLDVNYFMETFCSNHLHCVAGNYINELTEFCRMLHIPYELY
ncbi:MAG: hypothetical protein HFG20_06535 [Anaerotruncus sp.]|nr:hypothetical protein [Anaerotruncus sp.]